MRKAVVGLLLAAMLAVGVAVPVAAATPPGSCQGEIVSFAVQLFDGRRSVATTFFGDYPQAVQDAEWFVRTVCGI
jgi:hypothetical protein